MDQTESGLLRGDPDASDPRRALVEKLCEQVRRAKKRYDKDFDRMRKDQKFVRFQWADQGMDDARARVNILQRHIAQRTAALYAKNPTFTAERRKRLEFTLWDGTEGQLQQAVQETQQAMQMGMPPSPQTNALISDLEMGLSQKKMLDGVGKTLEILMEYALAEQQPPVKPRFKRLVRRAITTGVGYVKLGYQRQLRKRPDIEAKLADITDRLATIERLQADLQDGKVEANAAEAEELKIAQAALQAEPDAVVREGLIFDFPQSTRIIPDTSTRELVGWVGATWVAEEFVMTTDEIKEVYGVDIGGQSYTGYQINSGGEAKRSNAKDKLACVWEIYHRKDGVVYVAVDGYPDFLREPAAPDVVVEQFVPIYPLAFNEAENEDDLFPPSDVEFLRPLQLEINRKREALRQHRIAARPFYLGQRGKFEQTDIKDLNEVSAHEILFSNALDANEKLENVIQRFPSANVDPNLYETQSDIGDMTLIVGSSEANLGGTDAKTTATQTSVSETARMSSLSSNVDDLDEFLSLLSNDAGQVLLRLMQPDTVKKIVGPGAVWPQLTAQDIAEQVFLDIEAGSSGRPNKDQELANAERVVPMLLQIPGVSPDWMARWLIKTLDSKIDLEDALVSGLPAILTMNRQAQVATGDPATDPAQQGPQGQTNAPNDDTSTGGPQPAYPAPSTTQPNASPVGPGVG